MFGYVSSGSSADVRAAFDESGFTQVEKRKDGRVKQEIVAEHEKREEKQQVFEERKDLLATIGPYVFGGLFILDRKSTRLNSSHVAISYAVFCLKKKKTR